MSAATNALTRRSAGAAAGTDLGVERIPALVGGTLAGLLGLMMLVLAPVMLAASVLSGPDGQTGTGAADPIPAQFAAVLNEASRVWHVNAFLLASVAYQESRFASFPGWNTVNASGCIGLTQLGIGGACGNTWDARVTLADPAPARTVVVRTAYRYGTRPAGYPFATQSHGDVLDSFDNVMGAAVWLRHNADGKDIPDLDATAHRALCGYYGACADLVANYADDVLHRAQQWQTASRSPNSEPPPFASPTPFGGGALSWPVAMSVPVTSPFCRARSYTPCHAGVDLAVPLGTPLWSVGDGRVSYAAPASGYGNLVCIDHGAQLSSCYAHLQRTAVNAGQTIRRGQIIGTSGCTGHCHGPHLHFEIRIAGRPTCPAPWIAAPESTWCDPTWRQRAPAA